MKLKWRIGLRETGPYASFKKRSWPMAEYSDGTPAAMILCEDSYSIGRAKTGKHSILKLYIADHSPQPEGEGVWKWRKVKREFESLDEAKKAAVRILLKYPHFIFKGVEG